MKNSSDFFERVYEIVLNIPIGRVTTYGAIANAIGAPGASRMVGWAMNASHKSNLYVPAHRVVNRNGMLTGKHHFPGQNTMEELLNAENITVHNNKIVDFEKILWIPDVYDTN